MVQCRFILTKHRWSNQLDYSIFYPTPDSSSRASTPGGSMIFYRTTFMKGIMWLPTKYLTTKFRHITFRNTEVTLPAMRCTLLLACGFIYFPWLQDHVPHRQEAIRFYILFCNTSLWGLLCTSSAHNPLHAAQPIHLASFLRSFQLWRFLPSLKQPNHSTGDCCNVTWPCLDPAVYIWWTRVMNIQETIKIQSIGFKHNIRIL